MNVNNLWKSLQSILDKYRYLENVLKEKKFSKKIAFECIECLMSLDNLEYYYLGLNEMNITFEERFNDKEVNELIFNVRNLLTECILDKTIFSPEDLIQSFKILDFYGKDFLFIENPFTQRRLKLKIHLYVFGLHYFPVKKIYKEIDNFRDECISKYFLKEELKDLLDKFSHYLSLIEMMICNQLHIEENAYGSKLTEYELETNDEIEKTRLYKFHILYQLTNNINVELLNKIGVSPSNKLLNDLQSNITYKLYLLSYNLEFALDEYDWYSFKGSLSVISHSPSYWRDFNDKPRLVEFDIRNFDDSLFLDMEKYEPDTLYSFTPRIFDDKQLLSTRYN